MTEEQKAVEEMAQFIAEKLNKNQIFYVNQTYEDIGKQLADLLYSAHYRPEAEVRAETARDILGQIQSILGGMIKQDYEDSVQYYQGNCEDIDDRLQSIAEQFGKEE